MKNLIGVLILVVAAYVAIVGTATKMLVQAAQDNTPTIPAGTIGLISLVPATPNLTVGTIAWDNMKAYGANFYLLQWGTNPGRYSNTTYTKTNRASVNLYNGRTYYFQALSGNLVNTNFQLFSGQSHRLFLTLSSMGKAINVSTN